jgi:hypothetical protein
VTHVKFYGNFVNSDSPVFTDWLLDLLFHRLSRHANWSPSPGFITDVLSFVLKSFHPLTHSPLTQTTVSIPNLHSSVDFRRFHTLRQKKKRITLRCSSTVQVDSGAAMLYDLLRRLILLDRHLYGILLRSHFVSRNKIFHCAYFPCTLE